MKSEHIAIDLGAETGRLITGTIQDGFLEMKEIKRFSTRFLRFSGGYYWNIYRFLEEILDGLGSLEKEDLYQFTSIGIDSWGVDYVLLSTQDKILGLPHSYRDPRTQEAMNEFQERMDLGRVYDLTGIQMLQFNTLFQLFAEKKINPEVFKSVTGLLFIPDIFNYFLTGIKRTEFTFATTSQLYNPLSKSWEPELFRMLDISSDIMQNIVTPCSILGCLSQEIGKQTGLKDLPVISVASHDTASAIGAIPAEGDHWAFMSTGTWALIGFENDSPIINQKTRNYNFTNEGGINGFRILKNMMGFWIIQECRRVWGENKYSYESLMEMALQGKPYAFFINPDDNLFLNPENMPEAIAIYCNQTGQQLPVSISQIVRGILESLALKTRKIIAEINEIRDFPIEKIYITGGGVKNKLFCQFIANATGLEVIAVLAEGTAAGNILSQGIATGFIKNLSEGRQIIRGSIEPGIYYPSEIMRWNEAYEKYLTILNKKKLIQ